MVTPKPEEKVKPRWEVTFMCPVCHKLFSRVVEAETSLKAEKKFWGKTIECPHSLFVDGYELHKFKVKPEHIVGTIPYPWKPPAVPLGPKKEVGVPVGVPTAKKPPTERKAPTVLLSAKRIKNTVTVTIGLGKDYLGITFPRVEVETYDKLMKIAKTAGQSTIRNAILALLIVHSGGTKTMITGFLNASGFPEATVSTVGQALSRLRREKIIYRYPATFTYTYYPLALAKISTIRRCPECGSTRLMRDYESAEVVCMDCGYVIASKIAGGGYRLYGKKETVTTSEVMGEPVYGIPTATRMKILERLKFEPYFEWWKPEILKYTPPTIPKLKKPVEYEWIRFKKPAPRFRSAEDFKYYGPYRKGDLAKLPLIFAYFLVRTGYAEWLNPKKENVREAEKIFKYKSIEKMRRRATLLEY